MLNGFLKQSTASQTFALGPFIDDTDFKTPETGLTIANTDVKLIKGTSTTSVNKNFGGGTHIVNGKYGFTFDATDTETVGGLDVSIKVAGALIVTAKFWVLEEDIFDAFFAASANGFDSNGRVTVGTMAANVITASAIAANAIGSSELASNAIGASQIASNAITNAKIASGAITSTEATSIGTAEILGPGAISSLSFQANAISAGAIAASALNGKGDWNIGKTGYSLAADQSGVTIGTVTTNTDMRGTNNALLAASAPANFGDLAITATTGRVTVGTNNDKGGYSLSGPAIASIMAGGDIDGRSLEEAQRLIAAGVAGVLSGVESGMPVFKGINGSTKNRISATTDENGNRTAITEDVTP